jgi:N-acetylmuramoyl-L-alanine amidase
MKKYFIGILILFPLTITAPRTGDLRYLYTYIDNEASHLIRVINSEAIGQSYNEKLRVGSVVLNRVKSSKFPNTIEEVVCQETPNRQFNGINSKHFIINKSQSGIESIRASWYLLKNGSILPSCVLYFHNPTISTKKKWMDDIKHKLFMKGEGHWYFYE